MSHSGPARMTAQAPIRNRTPNARASASSRRHASPRCLDDSYFRGQLKLFKRPAAKTIAGLIADFDANWKRARIGVSSHLDRRTERSQFLVNGDHA